MRNVLAPVVILVSFVTAIPAIAAAGVFRNPCCCRVCAQPCGTCQCAHVQTQHVQQPVTAYRDVVETQYRTEAVNETVPTVSYENVTVDEGAYQTVWVSRPVSRQVARTKYQTRTSYRQVPYQVTRRVAEQTLQTVPTQAMRYAPATTASTCNTCGGRISSAVPASGVPYTAAVAPFVQSAQLNAGYGVPTAVTSSSAPLYAPTAVSSNSLAPIPDARFSSSAPTPVSPRMATVPSDGPYQPVNPVISDARSAGDGPSLFVPAPSAAQVWRTPRNTMMR